MNIATKKQIISLIYILAFFSLIGTIFTLIGVLIYAEDISSSYLNYTLNFCYILTIIFISLDVITIIVNFFLKKNINWIEVAMHSATLVLLIVLTIISTNHDIPQLLASFFMSNLTTLGCIVILLVTKLLLIFCFKKEKDND